MSLLVSSNIEDNNKFFTNFYAERNRQLGRDPADFGTILSADVLKKMTSYVPVEYSAEKVERSSFHIFKSLILNLFSFGFWGRHKISQLLNSLENEDLPAAKKIFFEGWRLDSFDIADLIDKGKIKSAIFAIKQLNTVDDLENVIRRSQWRLIKGERTDNIKRLFILTLKFAFAEHLKLKRRDNPFYELHTHFYRLNGASLAAGVKTLALIAKEGIDFRKKYKLDCNPAFIGITCIDYLLDVHQYHIDDAFLDDATTLLQRVFCQDNVDSFAYLLEKRGASIDKLFTPESIKRLLPSLKVSHRCLAYLAKSEKYQNTVGQFIHIFVQSPIKDKARRDLIESLVPYANINDRALLRSKVQNYDDEMNARKTFEEELLRMHSELKQKHEAELAISTARFLEELAESRRQLEARLIGRVANIHARQPVV